MSGFLETLSQSLSRNIWLAPLMAFLAGILSSFMPCSLSSIPLVISYVGNVAGRKAASALKLSLTFAAGAAVTFTALGVISSLAGKLFGTTTTWWYIILGVLMVLMALQMWGVFELIPANQLISIGPGKGYIGAFIAGILGGLFSSPCSTPVLIALLTIVSSKASMAWGILLLLFYSAGHGMLAVIAGTSMGFVNKMSSSKEYGKISGFLKVIMGILILLVGFYMFYLGF